MVVPVEVRRQQVARLLLGLLVFNTLLFVWASMMHLGMRATIGPLDLGFPAAIVSAAIVEGLIALAFGIASIARFTGMLWGRIAAISAHVIALLGVTLGMVQGPQFGPDREIHYLMLSLILVGFVLLFMPIVVGAPKRASKAKVRRS